MDCSRLPKISVIVDNYNYSEYLADAMQSVVSQSFTDFELIVVDDGSTDASRQIIDEFDDCRMIKVFKENGGQLSALNAGVASVRGEIVAFLDSDDTWPPDYLQTVFDFYQLAEDCDYLCFPIKIFGRLHGCEPDYRVPVEFGNHGFTACFLHKWVGRPTSACTIRSRIMRQILPLPEIEADWKICADDIIALGTDIIGGRKFYLPEPHVNYRVHDRNGFFGRRITPAEYAERKRNKTEFCRLLSQKQTVEVAALLRAELDSPSLPRSVLLRAYLRMLLLDWEQRKYLLLPGHALQIGQLLFHNIRPLNNIVRQHFKL